MNNTDIESVLKSLRSLSFFLHPDLSIPLSLRTLLTRRQSLPGKFTGSGAAGVSELGKWAGRDASEVLQLNTGALISLLTCGIGVRPDLVRRAELG